MLVVFDGLIGAGKSTAIDVLRERLERDGRKVIVIREPLDIWLERGRLQQFYEALGRRSYQFQTMAFHTRITEMRRALRGLDGLNQTVILMERSIFSDKLFAQILFEQGHMDQSEMEDYEDLWTMWTELLPVLPDLFVYLRPSFEVVLGRQRARAREGETVTSDYQELLLKRTDAFYEAGEYQLTAERVVPMATLVTDYDYRTEEEGKERLYRSFLELVESRVPSAQEITT